MVWEISSRGISNLLSPTAFAFSSVPRTVLNSQGGGKHVVVHARSSQRMQPLLFSPHFGFLKRSLGTVFAETKRIKWLNIIFPKLTPTSSTNMHMTPYSFLRLEQAGLIKILYIFQEISETMTLRMTNGMTKTLDNNVTLYFFSLIPKHLTHYLMLSRLYHYVRVCVHGRGCYSIYFP